MTPGDAWSRRASRIALLAAVLAPAAGAAAADPGDGECRKGASFDIAEYRVRGNTVLGAREIERAVLPHTGPGRDLCDVERARDALEKAYHERGFLTVLVDIPPQKVGAGVVLLRITEGSVRRVRVTGSRYFSLGEIREALPSLAEGGVPDFHALQKELNAVNSSADRRVTPVLKAASVPGRVDVELKVEDQFPLHGSLEVHNRHTLNTAPWRIAGQLRYDNLWQRQHSISLYYEVAPERQGDANIRSLSYVFPAGGGVRVAAYALRSRSDIAAVGALDVIGRGDVLGARVMVPVSTEGGRLHTLTLGVDHKDFDRQITFAGDPAVRTPLRYSPVSADYSIDRSGGYGTDVIEAGASLLPRGLASDPRQFAAARTNADTGYLIVRGGLRRVEPLPNRWSLAWRVDGQLASGPLVGNEQFAAGGAATVRGYRELEALGDDGVRASIELRTTGATEAAGAGNQRYVVAFLEGAQLAVREPLPSQQANFRLLGTGVGLRWRRERLALDMDGAIALRDASSTPAAGGTAGGDRLLHFRLAYAF